jgi:hypothetical protein
MREREDPCAGKQPQERFDSADPVSAAEPPFQRRKGGSASPGCVGAGGLLRAHLNVPVLHEEGESKEVDLVAVDGCVRRVKLELRNPVRVV